MALSPKRTLVAGGAVAGVLLLYALGAEKQGGATTEPAANTGGCRVAVTADVLNVRAAPGTDAQVVAKLRRGDQIDADRTVQNGFRRAGENRWVSVRYLTPLPGADCG